MAEENWIHLHRIQQIPAECRKSGGKVSACDCKEKKKIFVIIWIKDELALRQNNVPSACTMSTFLLSRIERDHFNEWYKITPYRVGYSVKKYFKEEDLYKDRDSQIQAIEATFEAAKVPVSYIAVAFRRRKFNIINNDFIS